MLSDPNEIFIEGINGVQDEPVRDRTKSGAPAQNLRTQLLGDNFRKERQFKLEVLNWLNDGKPKLFRSPGEGNYIVRLMNVSLSPNDTLGRMLHTFSCTAYEIADYTFENLNKYKFIKAPISTYSETSMGQRSLREVFGGVETPADGTEYTIEPSAALSLSISEQYYDSLILKFEYQGGIVSDNLEICNPTGQLNIPITDKPITKIIFVSGKIAKEALMSYVYEDVSVENNFSQITDITIEDKLAQYVGGNKDENLIDTLEDIKFQTGRFYYINATPRRILIIHTKDGEYYKDADHKLPQTTWDKTVVYEVFENGKYLYGSPDDEREVFPDYNLTINSESYSNLEPALHGGVYRTQGDFKTITNLDRVHTLKFGSGIIINLVY
jgi:hypothetical protein